MPLFMCATCGCYDNTATSGYWAQEMDYVSTHNSRQGFKPLCSEHNPSIGQWHGRWPKESAAGWLVDARGFIWTPSQAESMQHLGPFKSVELPAGV